jgi:hypothetical protein
MRAGNPSNARPGTPSGGAGASATGDGASGAPYTFASQPATDTVSTAAVAISSIDGRARMALLRRSFLGHV